MYSSSCSTAINGSLLLMEMRRMSPSAFTTPGICRYFSSVAIQRMVSSVL